MKSFIKRCFNCREFLGTLHLLTNVIFYFPRSVLVAIFVSFLLLCGGLRTQIWLKTELVVSFVVGLYWMCHYSCK